MHVTELFVTLLLHRVLRLVCLHFARRPFLLNITQLAMNKYYRKVLDALKTNRDIKALGFSRKELKGVAANVANKLQLKDDATDEEVSEGISDAIDDVLPLLQLTQSAADRQVSEYKNAHPAPDDDDVPPDDEQDDDDDPARRSPSQKGKNGKKGKKDSDDDQDSAILNAIKGLTTAVATLQGDVTALKSGNTTSSRTAKVRELLKDTGKFGERRLKSFSHMKFENEEEFEDYLDELKEDIEEENKERLEKGLEKLGRIPAPDTTHQQKVEDKLMSDDEVKKLAQM